MTKRQLQLAWDGQPTLHGQLISLRPLTKMDFDALYLAASDPLIWEQHPQKERYQKPVFQKFFEEALDSQGAFAVVDNQTNEIIGSSRYYNLVPDKEITIGYTFLMRKYWGGAFNRELKSLMLNHAFQFVPSVCFVIGERNFRSRRAIEKIGAKLDLRVDENGPAGAHVVYRMDRGDFSQSFAQTKA